MAKNLIPEICKMLGVEIGEEFKIKGYEEWFYKFDNDRVLMFKHNDDAKMPVAPVSVYVAFLALLRGEREIIKLPWKPKQGEKYWGFLYSQLNDAWLLALYTWGNNPEDFAFYKAGWVFHTKKEAKAALPAVAAEFGVEYKL